MKKMIAFVLAVVLLSVAGVAALIVSINSSLPQIMNVSDYKPLLVSEVYARSGERLGDFSREIRKLTPIEKIPKRLIDAFVAIEDRQFFEHTGINYLAIARAALANFTSGRTKQGASTITQQLAKQLFLSPERTYTRKIKEALLAKRLEENLTKEEILYLYLNQIYFGSGAHGVEAAAEIYFRKKLDTLSLGEIAVIAGLPQRPADYSPIENPRLAKGRQREVLNALAATGKVTQEEADKAFNEPLTVYLRRDYKEVAPFAVETIRQLLVAKLGENKVLDEGIKIYTTIDFKQQQAAQEQVRDGLRDLDKRQGYRGAIKKIDNTEEQTKFLLTVRDGLIKDKAPIRVVTPEGNVQGERPLEIFHKKDAKGAIITNLPDYFPVGKVAEALVTRVDDELGLVYLRVAEAEALLDISDMTWARKPDPAVRAENAAKLTKPSSALKAHDVILVKALAHRFGDALSPEREKELQTKIATLRKTNPKFNVPNFAAFAQVALEQEPLVEGALIAFDLKTSDTVAMVGGYDFKTSKFNRALQAKRQTGSIFKSIVYAAALDKGFSPATPVFDSPIVYEGDASAVEGQDTDIKKWKPHNHGEKFAGDVLFRSALIRSLNIPTVKILESIGVPWVIDYARRWGVFSPLNADLSLGLGSSSLTLYEMTRVFSQFGRLGKRLRPLLVTKVTDRDGNVLLADLNLDAFFEKELTPIEQEYEKKRTAALEELKSKPAAAPAATDKGDAAKVRETPKIYFSDPEQVMAPQTAYVITSLLQAVVSDPGGTAAQARSLGRPIAGKTGSTNGYIDGWFVGYTPGLAAGVWVGFNEEKTLGPGEVGGRTALPIWIEFMRGALGDSPAQNFPAPPGIVYANIDEHTGKLASASSRTVVNQAFIQGTEPKEQNGAPSQQDDTDFYKQDLTE